MFKESFTTRTSLVSTPGFTADMEGTGASSRSSSMIGPDRGGGFFFRTTFFTTGGFLMSPIHAHVANPAMNAGSATRSLRWYTNRSLPPRTRAARDKP